MQSDTKIFHEVNGLNRLSHCNIALYYVTWVEAYEPSTPTSASVPGSDSGKASSKDVMTSVPTLSHRTKHKHIYIYQNDDSGVSNNNEHHLPINGTFWLNIGDIDDLVVSRSSFLGVYFSSRTSLPDIGEDGESTNSSGEDGRGFGAIQ